MDEFTFLLDAPAAPVTRMPVAQIGDFKDPRYGEFSITHAEAKDWAKNLAQLPGGRALIDEDHLSDKPSPHRRTEASGWITNLDVDIDSKVVMGDVHWTPKGESAIEEERYLFFSPAFGKYRNERGEEFEHVLTGGALTNKPFLTQMPVITLASAPRLLEAARQDSEGDDSIFTLDQAYEQGLQTLDISQELREKHAVVVKEINGKKVHMFPIPPGDKEHARAALSLLPSAIKAGHINSSEAAQVRSRANGVLGKKEMSDSRHQMQLTANTLIALGITDEDLQKKLLEEAEAEDADATQVMQNITKAAAEGGGGNGEPAKTLEEQASAAGKVLLDSSQVNGLMARASQGSDSPSLDGVTPELLTTLGIEDEDSQKKILDLAGADDADLPKLLGAIMTAKQPDTPAPGEGGAEQKTLEQMAEAEGKVLLDGPALAQLVHDSKAGVEAKKQLETQTFETRFEKNVREGKVTPAQKEQMLAFYNLDSAGTLKLMDEAPKVLNTQPQGRNIKAPDENMPDGVHQEGFELDSLVQNYMQEHSEKDYVKALEAVTGTKVGQ